MMAGTGSLTLTKLAGPYTIGDRWETVYQAVGDTSYVDNGYPLLRTSLGFAATPDPEFHVEIETVSTRSATAGKPSIRLSATPVTWTTAIRSCGQASDSRLRPTPSSMSR